MIKNRSGKWKNNTREWIALYLYSNSINKKRNSLHSPKSYLSCNSVPLKVSYHEESRTFLSKRSSNRLYLRTANETLCFLTVACLAEKAVLDNGLIEGGFFLYGQNGRKHVQPNSPRFFWATCQDQLILAWNSKTG